MAKYVRLKKYLRFIVPAAIIVGAILVPKIDNSGKGGKARATVETAGSSQVSVSQAEQQAYLTADAINLQPAAAPAHSVTSPALSPQQAAPNYCAPGEQPYIDGCIAK